MVHKKFTRGHWHTIFTSKMEKNRTLWAQEIWENSLLSKCDCFSSSLKPLGDLSLMPVWPSFVSFYWYQLLNGPALHILESFSVLAMRFFQVNVLSAVFLLPCWLEPKGKAKCLFSQLKGTAPVISSVRKWVLEIVKRPPSMPLQEKSTASNDQSLLYLRISKRSISWSSNPSR